MCCTAELTALLDCYFVVASLLTECSTAALYLAKLQLSQMAFVTSCTWQLASHKVPQGVWEDTDMRQTAKDPCSVAT